MFAWHFELLQEDSLADQVCLGEWAGAVQLSDSHVKSPVFSGFERDFVSSY